jgi:C-terminal processing protease CtpA/Prc
MKYFSLSLALMLCAAAPAMAQTMTANQAAEKAQSARDEAEKIWYKKGVSPDSVALGIAKYRTILAFLDSVPIRRLAEGNRFLAGRKHDVTLDLVRVYAAAGKKDSALITLQQYIDMGYYGGVASYLLNDGDFSAIRNEPGFKDIVATMQRKKGLWTQAAFKTGFHGMPSDADKAAAVSLLWSMAKYNFVHFDHAAIDWDSTYRWTLAQALATRNLTDYYHVLFHFYALLKDGHTNVYPPSELSDSFYARPPFRTELVEGRVFITHVFSDSLLKTGIQPGLELLSIDSIPIVAYGEKYVKPYQCSSTPQDLEIREFAYALFSGQSDKPMRMVFRDKGGKVFGRDIPRSGYAGVTTLPSVAFKLYGDIAYLAINNFTDYSIPRQFDSLYPVIARTKGLILDLRYNGGGGDDICFPIMARLINKPVDVSDSRNLSFTSRQGDEPQWIGNGYGQIDPEGRIYYDKSVVVLVGPRTFSAGEDFLVPFQMAHRGKIIGLPTGGSSGAPTWFELPGGGQARVCSKDDLYPDGRQFIGIGIKPDIEVPKTIKDLQNGHDATISKALEVLK